MPPARTVFVGFALAGLLLAGLRAGAQNVPHLSQPQRGGMPGLPVMNGIERGTNGVVISWDGPSGYYELQESPGLKGSKWQAVGKATNLVRTATVQPTSGHSFFRVAGPSPQYAGAQVCAECHAAIHSTELNTHHAGAYTNPAFAALGGQTNASCLDCHTVGYGLPTGFINAAKTPLLEGVQCENCHGPAAVHAANPGDPTAVPQVELAATVCGGCHDVARFPAFEEWRSSAHAGVVEDLNPANRIDACGRCHSGSVRLSLLKGTPLPVGDANLGVVCITCHDPHQTNGFPAQLRNPLASTNDYFVTTSGALTNQYQPAINLCAQCHNHRGADWTDSSRPPHHSPQYNVLLGTVGELADGLPPYQPAAHALLITNQCVGCHMQTQNFGVEGAVVKTGHSFTVDLYDACLACHPLPEALVQFTTGAISNQLQTIKADLDLWATTKAPLSLRSKYGARAWEYSTPGDLSSGGSGPAAAEQALIPLNIQKARFNLYLVLNDGSYGVHNGPYCVTLLNTAQDWVEAELNP